MLNTKERKVLRKVYGPVTEQEALRLRTTNERTNERRNYIKPLT
jgi:ribosomal protein S28E/S33